MHFKAPSLIKSPSLKQGLVVLIGGMILMALCACGQKSPEKPAAQNSVFLKDSTVKIAPRSVVGTDSAGNIRSLLDTVIARLQRRDTVGLVRLLVDDSTYRRHLFPISSAYDSTSEEAFKFVLGMHKANSAKGLRRVLAEVEKAEGMLGVNGIKGTAKQSIDFITELDSTHFPGGMLFQTHQGEGIRPLGTALCVQGACRIATFGHPGSQGE